MPLAPFESYGFEVRNSHLVFLLLGRVEIRVGHPEASKVGDLQGPSLQDTLCLPGITTNSISSLCFR